MKRVADTDGRDEQRLVYGKAYRLYLIATFKYTPAIIWISETTNFVLVQISDNLGALEKPSGCFHHC